MDYLGFSLHMLYIISCFSYVINTGVDFSPPSDASVVHFFEHMYNQGDFIIRGLVEGKAARVFVTTSNLNNIKKDEKIKKGKKIVCRLYLSRYSFLYFRHKKDGGVENLSCVSFVLYIKKGARRSIFTLITVITIN